MSRVWLEMPQWVLNYWNWIIILASRFHSNALYQVQPHNHSSHPLVIIPQMKHWGDGESPVFCLQQVHTVNTAIIATYTARKNFFFCAVSDLHIKTCSEQKWELMSCLLCAILSEINRYGCMKGPCVTKGSNGKFLITWNIRKGDAFFLSNTSPVVVYFFQLFQGSEARHLAA